MVASDLKVTDEKEMTPKLRSTSIGSVETSVANFGGKVKNVILSKMGKCV